MRGSIFFLPLVLCVRTLESAKILMSGVLGEGSHFTALVPIGKSLVNKGHNVTFLISDEYSYRARDPELSTIFEFEIFHYNDKTLNAREFFRGYEKIGIEGSNGFLQLLQMYKIGRRIQVDICESVLQDNDMMSRLASMDAIVFELPWPCSIFIKSYIERHLNATDVRMVLSSATAPVPAMFLMAGSPFNPSYQPASYTSYSSSMNFFQRITNGVYSLVLHSIMEFIFNNAYKHTVEKFDLHENLASLSTSQKHIDLFLTNCDFAVEFPFPLMPNVIAVGGLTARPAMPLDQELEDFMQSSGKHGVVVFSMGSYFASFTTYRPDIMNMILEVLSKLPQKVVMQIKDPSLYSLPENVKAMTWIPQNDLLGHPKTKVFLFHAGNNGYLEALWHGVPMVVIPIFGDHIDVTVRIVSRGLGLMISKENVSTDYLHHRLQEVLSNPAYSITAKRLSAIFRDRPLGPADRAAFWIEHVIKHGGKYMQSPVYDLSFIQYHFIDVGVFILLVLCMLLYSIFILLRKCVGHRNGNQSKGKTD
nr:UDP-glucuronosyltransferase 2B33-like [Lytechinus pictus]